MFREVALKRDDAELTARLERMAARYPSAATLETIVPKPPLEVVSARDCLPAARVATTRKRPTVMSA